MTDPDYLADRLVELTKQLIAVPSISPKDEGCQRILIDRLRALRFTITEVACGPVSNFWARRGHADPLFVFAGHTDVVPAGPLEFWQTNPFSAVIHNDSLYGRGAVDMKGGLAAMILAVEEFLEQFPNHPGSIGFLITSGEEGDDFDKGTPVLMQHLSANHEVIKWCLIGEPSSHKLLGDTIRIGRRGSLTATATIKGKQGHVAYPHLADNPIHRSSAAINDLVQQTWDQGNQYFPPTSLQISQIAAGSEGAANIIPGELSLVFNFRFSSESDHLQLQQRVETLLAKHQLKFKINWKLNGKPFLTKQGNLVTAAQALISEITGLNPVLSTAGGTSDGRFIAPYGIEVIELGLLNHSAHQANEACAIKDLSLLSQIYCAILQKLLVKSDKK